VSLAFRVPLMSGGSVVLENPWVISDPHFGDPRISSYTGRPVGHTEEILSRWRARVGLNEPVLLLGDIVISNDSALFDAIAALPGRKVLLRGNHDTQSSLWFGRALGMEVIAAKRPHKNCPRGEAISLPWQGARLQLSHIPRSWHDDTWDINVHGHIHRHQKRCRAYVNACVECRDYTPVRLLDLLAEAIPRCQISSHPSP
jgi:calcineurin-like phosphoesterase family protein